MVTKKIVPYENFDEHRVFFENAKKTISIKGAL